MGTNSEQLHWFVMRDLKRPNAKLPAYKQLQDMGFEVYVPMKWQLLVRKGKRLKEKIPVMRDLLFVHTTRESLDPVVAKTATLQYRYIRGDAYRNPMIVRNADMERFIYAVGSSDDPKYYLPGELTSDVYGQYVRIVGGMLDGYEGKLLTVRGSRVKRLLVELPGLFAAGVKVESEYVQIL